MISPTVRLPFKGQLEKTQFYTLTTVALIAAIIGLPVATYLVTYQQMLSVEYDIAVGHARSVLVRSDRISRELEADLSKLDAARGDGGACSEASMTMMRNLTVQSLDFVLIGHIQNNKVICSSFGQNFGIFDVGPIDFKGHHSARRNVRVPSAPNTSFFAVEDHGWIFFFLPIQPIDVPAYGRASLATYSPIARQFRTSHGFVRPEWMSAGKPGRATTFVENGYIVAVVQSTTFPSGVIAAVPHSEWMSRIYVVVGIAIGIAILCGISIAAWIIHIARQRLIISPYTLRRALKNDEFYLVYQPIIDLRTNRWVGAEALMRWKRSEGVEISPDIFISAAETMGFIGKLTERLLMLVSRDAPAIFETTDSFYLSINLAADDVKSVSILEDLKNLLKKCNCCADRFKVEITERSILDEIVGREVINGIRSLGLKVVVDDFGTGFSNLKYLTTFKFDYLKIDKAFVQGIGTDAVTGDVAFHVIEMAKSLKLGLIAEGVETEEQARILLYSGVEMAQGWLFSCPKTASDLIDALHQVSAKPVLNGQQHS